uniref:Uncharacterized protein n=1 Tax=Scophthalmus maximus TaxID=52904 RepID=A0A8D3BIJ8_SCOMX
KNIYIYIFSTDAKGQSSSRTGSVLSGEEARRFYENVMRDCDERGRDGPKRASRRKDYDEDAQRRETAAAAARETGNSERSAELQGLRFLRCAHEGDTSGLKELLSREVDINFQDTFFWTAVMCASWSGRRAAVRLLLQRGAAWVGVVDTRGRDAKDLALEAGHSDVLEELESFGGSAQRDTTSDGRLAHTW